MNETREGPRIRAVQRRAVLAGAMAITALSIGAGTAAAQVPGEKTAGGILFRIGLAGPETVAQHSARHAETGMHGNRPRSGMDHVVVVLADARSGERISDAVVSLELDRPGADHVRREMDRMEVQGAASYGAYVDLRQKGPYRIRIRAARPGHSVPAETQFTYDKR